MEGLERAKLKDRILSFLLEHNNSSWGNNALYERLGKPTNSQAHLIDVIGEMIDKAGKYFDYTGNETFGYTITANDFTQEFLDDGGFVGEYNKQVEAVKKLNENIMRESKVKELEEIELKQKIRNNRYALPLSITSILIALGSLLYTIFLPKPEKGSDGQLKAIQERMDYMEVNWKKEKDSIKLEFDKIKDTIK